MQSHGDPCLTSYWLRNAATWRDQVDELLVLVNRQTNVRIVNFLRRETEKVGGVFYHVHGHLIHGEATRMLVGHTDASHVLLIEDDAFVRYPDAVGSAFESVENDTYVVRGSPRGCMSPDLEAAAQAKWGVPEPMSIEGDLSGYGLWPNFVVAETALLRATTQKYESFFWPEGEMIPGIGVEAAPGGSHTDSFTGTAFELRGLGAKIVPIEQWAHTARQTIPDAVRPGWFHAGGLSNGDFLNYGNFGNVHDCGGNNEGLDWARRLWWWRRAFDTRSEDCLTERESELYATSLDRLTAELNVAEQVAEWDKTEPWWITWDDAA